MGIDFNVVAETRKDVGKGASRRLRHADKIPGVIYGAGKDAVALTMRHDSVFHHLEHEAFYSHILTITVDGNVERAVLKDVQRHPAKPKILHVDFLRISDVDKISMNVPLHFMNELDSPGVKAGGLVSHLMNNVEIICLAKDLPEYLEVDLANLEAGASLHLSDIKLPAGVEMPALAQSADHDLPIVNIHAPRQSTEEEASADEAVAEPPSAES
ncbi:MAG: 50S ribosomal protein L25/general stress protein Ctc [Gammaproteobacteria bacterium]|nr:50S ribosomal protein L25/general stress protein Ctc [Gammaproteobacteria bacterium]